MAKGIFLYLGTREGQQRAHHDAIDGEYAVQAGKAGAAKQVEKESLVGVIAVMGCEQRRVAMFTTQTRKPVVSEPPSSILRAESMLTGILAGLELCHMYRHPVVAGKCPDKGFVAVAVVGTKVEVAVGNGIREAGRMHEVSQNYGVDTTADSKQHLLPRGEEVLLNDMCYESL